MKLILTSMPEISETEVEIRYSQLDTRVENLINIFEQGQQYLYGEENGRQFRIFIYDIYYAETIDRKTFIYTKSAVYRSELKLYQLLNKLKYANFVQVSKSCVMNINVLDNIQTMHNSRMEGTLINGETLIISRTYIPNIKAAFAENGGN